MMASPGSGVQQRASFTQMSLELIPATVTPASEPTDFNRVDPGMTASERVSSVPSPPPRLSTSFWTTLWAEMWFSPTAAYRPDTSW